MNKAIFICFAALLLYACDRAAYVAPAPGLIRNQSYMYSDAGKLAGWKVAQHAEQGSYVVSSEGGVLSLTRVGEEPWGAVMQSVKRKDLPGLLGATLEFSVDVSGVYTDEYGEPMHEPSLSVLVQGFPLGAKRMLGARSLLVDRVSVVSEVGDVDWSRHKLRFTVPSEVGLMLTKLEVSLVMTRGGVMKVRGPSLVLVDEQLTLPSGK